MQFLTYSEVIQAKISLFDEKFDYTEWRKKNLVGMDLETLHKEIAAYNKIHPFQGGKNNV